VLLTSISFSTSRSLIVNMFRTFGRLRYVNMPRHRPLRPESHRGFAVITYSTAHETDAALRNAPARLRDAGCGGVRLQRLADVPQYKKYCEGVNVEAVMNSSRTDVCTYQRLERKAALRERTTCKGKTGSYEDLRSVLKHDGDLRSFLTRKESASRQMEEPAKTVEECIHGEKNDKLPRPSTSKEL